MASCFAFFLSSTSSTGSPVPGRADQLTSLPSPSLSSALVSAAGRGPPRSKSDALRRFSIASSTHHAGTGKSARGFSPSVPSFFFRGSGVAFSDSREGTSTGFAGSKTGSCAYPSAWRHSFFRADASFSPFRDVFSPAESVARFFVAPPAAGASAPCGALRLEPLASVAGAPEPGAGEPRRGSPSPPPPAAASPAFPPPAASLVSAGPNLPWATMRRTRASTLSVYRDETATVRFRGSEPSPSRPSSRAAAARRRRIFFASSYAFAAVPGSAAFAFGRGAGGGAAPPRPSARAAFLARFAAMSLSAIHSLSPALFTSRSSPTNPLASQASIICHSYGPCTTPWRWRRDDPGGDGHGKARGRDGFVRSETREVRRDARDEVVRSRRGAVGSVGIARRSARETQTLRA